ncbi:unnamed protein product [Acanthoscelides obtectus]|uniref:Uncharacterized protein n=1 Tax=Acanthoscelides obtectus TaxID=200917 RepID=A0A9P0L9C4_ACAOB|nr:unnamed protein product [Acanthoscelides obtectus]CAK1663174.1 hypothetical protein AOBTE_LOCUS23533 [Acanthoscelides obtectus]
MSRSGDHAATKYCCRKSYSAKMKYDKFATIVGPKKIEMFQNIDGKTEENEISDENLRLSFKTWRFFRNGDTIPTDITEPKNKINIV